MYHLTCLRSTSESVYSITDWRSANDDVVGPSDSESFLSERDELFGPKRYKRGFKRPRLQWELVSSWNKDHVAPDDYQGEIMRIMAKSMHDARLEVTPRYNARAISDFFVLKRWKHSNRVFTKLYLLLFWVSNFVFSRPRQARNESSLVCLSICQQMRMSCQIQSGYEWDGSTSIYLWQAPARQSLGGLFLSLLETAAASCCSGCCAHASDGELHRRPPKS